MINLFVTGAEKNPHKIFVTAGLSATMQSLGYSTGVYKPVETGVIEKEGFIQSRDLAYIKFTDTFVKTYYSYLLKEKSAPILSAAAEGKIIEKDVILKDFQDIQDINEILIIDGLFGPATPLGKDFLEEDLIKILDTPVLFAVDALKTSINTILLSLNSVEKSNVRGVILQNFPAETENADIKLMPRLIEEYTDGKVLGILPEFPKNISPDKLINEILTGVDVEGVFKVQIAKLRE